MPWRTRKSFKIFAAGSSLRKRVACSMAIARLILVPVILLAVYYLFVMGRIVDRIVNVDAPAAKLAEQASIEILEARRAARNYLCSGPGISSDEPEITRQCEASPGSYWGT